MSRKRSNMHVRLWWVVLLCGVLLGGAVVVGCGSDNGTGEADAEGASGEGTGNEEGSQPDDNGGAVDPVMLCAELTSHLMTECQFSSAQVGEAVAVCTMIVQTLDGDAAEAFVDCLQDQPCTVWEDETEILQALSRCTLAGAATMPPSEAGEALKTDLCTYYGTCEGIHPLICEAMLDMSGYGALFSLVDDTTAELVSDCIPDTPECTEAESAFMMDCLQAPFSSFR